MSWFNRKNTPEQNNIGNFIKASPIAIAEIDDEGVILEYNEAFDEITSLTSTAKTPDSEIKFQELLDDENSEIFNNHRKTIADDFSQKSNQINLELKSNAGEGAETTIISLYISKVTICDNHTATLLYLIDETEQKNLEMRFVHSQKMQAVGQLAGGIAHDFNNLLTAMIGFCDLLLMRHPAGDPSFADIMQVKQNANRAANLVRQLLAFSRKQTLQPKTIDITELLAELSNLIRRLIGENIELEINHGSSLAYAKADQGQLEQVIINLAVNARDAMKSGGSLAIKTKNITIDNANPIDKNYIPPEKDDIIKHGDYILIEISDTGHGIPLNIIEKIFEPFFSTKAVGEGTGLGLSTVYGIIKQTGGYLYIKSEENKGSTFAIFFPQHKGDVDSNVVLDDYNIDNKTDNENSTNQVSDLTGAATILLVEDETPVRIFAARALKNKGYTILEAESGENAIEVFEAANDKIDVIISDVVMPGMNGPTMIETLFEKHSDKLKNTQVIFISGYAEDAFVDGYDTSREFNFLPKPFTLKQLASKIKEVLQKN